MHGPGAGAEVTAGRVFCDIWQLARDLGKDETFDTRDGGGSWSTRWNRGSLSLVKMNVREAGKVCQKKSWNDHIRKHKWSKWELFPRIFECSYQGLLTKRSLCI